MTHLKALAVIGAVTAAFLGVSNKTQRKQEQPSITFGTAEVSLGMTVEQVEKALAESARHIELMSDKHTALVRINNVPALEGHKKRYTSVEITIGAIPRSK